MLYQINYIRVYFVDLFYRFHIYSVQRSLLSFAEWLKK